MKLALDAHLLAPPDATRRLFRDVAHWPSWLPGVRAVEVETDRSGGDVTAHIEQVVSGRLLRQTALVTPTSTGFVQRRIAGEPKRWILSWSFETADDGQATAIRVEIDYDFGLWTTLTPRRLVETALEDTFRALVDAAAARLAPSALDGTETLEDVEILFRGVPSPGGRLSIIEDLDGTFRIVFDGCTYRAQR